MMHRLHVVSLPHTHTTLDFECCAYTSKVRKFCDMMTAHGNVVYLYAGERNDANCAVHVPCISEESRLRAVGDEHYVMRASFDPSAPHWREFNERATREIASRARARDFLCLIGGTAQKPIADALPHLKTVEFGVGYSGVFAEHRVWESHAWQHCVLGAQYHRNPMNARGVFFDAVVPGYLETARFPRGPEPRGEHVAFLGRCVEAKGVHVAVEIARATCRRLEIAGPGTPPSHPLVTHLGPVGPEERAAFLGRARAVLMPTLYVEPFGNVAVEAMACGTPVVCSDWGAMTETVVHGVTGFRCRTLREYAVAVERAGDLDRAAIREYAVARFSTETVGRQYQDYFDRLSTLWGRGWYEGTSL
jgi:glycosyltransferase involved in cell wall biosynthesis